MATFDNKSALINAIAEFNKPGRRAAFPDCHLTLGNIVSEGDFVANNFRLTGTHQGPLLGTPATGRAIDVEGVTILRFADGKCVERWSQTDLMGILRQIGAAS